VRCQKLKSYFCFFILIFSSLSEAREFDFGSQTFSTYLRGTGGFCNLQRGAYAPGFPSSVVFNDSNSTTYSYSAELGFAYTSPKAYTLRVGVELLYPNSSASTTGYNSSNAALFNLSSKMYSVIPQANVEIFLKKKPNYRIYLGLGGGYALTTFTNTVTMTAAGSSAYGEGSYTESASGNGIMGQGYLGLEFPAFDNVAFSFDLGYRYLKVSGYTANGGYTSLNGTTTTTGGAVVNADGTARTTDLGGASGAFNLRIYFN
jgi:hypothetical protein